MTQSRFMTQQHRCG